MGRSFVLAVCLLAPVSAAEAPSWDANYEAGLGATKAGRYAEARALLADSLEQARAFSQPDVRHVQSAHSLALVEQQQGQLEHAGALYLEAKSSLEEMGSAGKPLLGYVLDGLGQVRLDQGRLNEAEPLLRQAQALCRETRGSNDICTLTTQKDLGEVLASAGSNGEAERLFQNLVDTMRKMPSPPAELFASTLSNLGGLYTVNGRYELAEPLLDESLEVGRRGLVAEVVIADSVVNLADLYRLEHNAGRAQPLLKKALHIYESANDPHQAAALNELGLIAMEEGKFAVAKDHFSRALNIYEHLVGSTHMSVARVKGQMAQALLGERNYKQAKSMIEDALNTGRQVLGVAQSEFAGLLLVAGRVEEQGHRTKEAGEYYRQAVEVCRETLAAGHPERTEAEQQYARFTKSQRQ